MSKKPVDDSKVKPPATDERSKAAPKKARATTGKPNAASKKSAASAVKATPAKEKAKTAKAAPAKKSAVATRAKTVTKAKTASKVKTAKEAKTASKLHTRTKEKPETLEIQPVPEVESALVAGVTAAPLETAPAPATERETPPATAAAAQQSAAAAEPTAAAADHEVAAEQEIEPEAEAGTHAAANLERLQKILSQAGIASRRHAEEMIVEGRVMVNGQVVNQLGAKADPLRDHIRVDGKLIHGAERHRTFVLNKPRGYVTTVSDPEGRPTVMDFFAKMPERLYPVGRLDFQSEGLLIMSNDGELANLLTRAGSGVEKVYMVKVAGQPGEEDLQRLRQGIQIERDRPGSERVRSAPARIRMIRPGENPWFEVTLIEGRNRELRKIFREVGHFVEKIRRVAYGPLVLDLEPGRFRELSLEEITALRMTAEGKLKPRIPKLESLVPREMGRSTESRFEKRAPQRKPGFSRPPDRQMGREAGFRREGKPEGRPEFRREGKPAFSREGRPEFKRESRPERRPEFRREGKPEFRREGKPEFRRESRPEGRPEFRREGKPAFRRQDNAGRPFQPRGERPPFFQKRSEPGRRFEGSGEKSPGGFQGRPPARPQPPAKPWTSGPGGSASDRGSRPGKSFGGRPAYGGRPARREEPGRGPGHPQSADSGTRPPDFRGQNAERRPGFRSRPGNTGGKRRG